MLRVFVILILVSVVPAQSAERLLVFAAASQHEAMQEIGSLYEARCNCEVVFSFAATSTLARQIDAGAAADVFISANTAWADWLEIRGGLNKHNRPVIAGNRLVIASAANTKDSFNVLFRGKFAMADPVSVPAGIYAREALENMQIWEQVRKNAVFAENVRVALSSIKRGTLLSGVVYQSDLKLLPELNTHYVFPEGSHTPIHYVAAEITEQGADFVEFLKSEKAQNAFQSFGFLPVSVTN